MGNASACLAGSLWPRGSPRSVKVVTVATYVACGACGARAVPVGANLAVCPSCEAVARR